MKDLPFYERDYQLSGIAAAGSAWNPSRFNNICRHAVTLWWHKVEEFYLSPATMARATARSTNDHNFEYFLLYTMSFGPVCQQCKEPLQVFNFFEFMYFV